MSKQNIVSRVQSALGEDSKVNQRHIEAVLGAVFDTLGDLEEDQSCRIRDFGVFKVKRREARQGNPVGKNAKDGGLIEIPARLAMTFKVSKQFKESLPPAPVAEAPKKATKKAAKKRAARKKKKS